MLVTCDYCKNEFEKRTGEVNRARKSGLNIYCNKTCSGFGRRSGLTVAEKKALKREYDKEYRTKNKKILKVKKSAYFARTYDREKAAIERKANMARHVEYCRRPEYKKWKSEYDQVYRAKKLYGDFWEAAIVLIELEKAIDVREAYQINRLFEKGTTQRKRKWQVNLRLKI